MSKKRMELRLKPKNWYNKNLTIEFPTELIVDEINFRDFVKKWWDMKKYSKLKLDDSLKIENNKSTLLKNLLKKILRK